MASQTSVPDTAVATAPLQRRDASTWWPLIRATLWGAIGATVLAGVTVLLQGEHALTELAVVLGYVGALTGWLLGIGGWEAGVRPFFGRENTWDEGTAGARYLRFNSDHKVVGMQYFVTAALTFVAAGFLAMLMRWELSTADLSFFGTKQDYNMTFSIHGTLMLFAVSVVGIVGGFGNYFVPLMLGADDMVFPRVNAISYWFVVPGVLAIASSPLIGGFQTGWTGYAPLSAQDAPGQLLYFLGVLTLGLSSVMTGINVVATTLYKRAPGLHWGRLPIFCWSMLVTAALNLLWVPVVGTAMLMGILDRLVPMNFFSDQGIPLLWQDLFWIFGHPEVYIIVLGAWGLWLEIIAVMSRKTLFAYRWAVAGFVIVGLLSGMVWVHHMFAAVSTNRWVPFMSTTEIISVPTGFMFLAVVGTLWRGRIRLNTPMLLTLMSVFCFLIGGVTGVFLADVPADLFFNDNYFVVAHFHYTIIGGMVFTWYAGAYYWLPKITGRMYNEQAGKIFAWLTFIAFNATFFQMFFAGFAGMNRRIAIYPAYLQGQNVAISIAAFILGPSFVLLAANLVSGARRGPRATDNPWGGKTLEWQTTSPPPHENFPVTPVITEDFYRYGRAGREPDTLPLPGRTREKVLEPTARETHTSED